MKEETILQLVVWRRFTSGRVKQWAVLDETGEVLFKSDHKGSCLTVIHLLTGGKAQ